MCTLSVRFPRRSLAPVSSRTPFYLCYLMHCCCNTQAFFVGLVSLGLSLRLGLTLILFYKSSSILTKVGFERKAKLTDDYKVSVR